MSIAATTSSDTTTSIVLVANQSTGNQSPFIDSGLSYNANTNTLVTTNIEGSLEGNALTATNLSTNRTNWASNGTISAVVGQLGWKNFSNNHTIFDASAGTSPNDTAVNNTNSTNPWTATYPTLMGWNGSQTYGVRVDSARVCDNPGGSYGVPGYQKMPGGFTIQWGQSSGALGEQAQPQTFAIAFTSAVFAVIATPISDNPPPGDKRDHWAVYNFNLNGFTLRSYFETRPVAYNWIAIGI